MQNCTRVSGIGRTESVALHFGTPVGDLEIWLVQMRVIWYLRIFGVFSLGEFAGNYE